MENQKQVIETIFTHDNLPPLFGKDFTGDNQDWKRLSGIDFERVGRVLVCHLLIEHHLSKLLDLRTPSYFDWDEAKLTFIQKIKLLKKDIMFKEYEFLKGAEVINKIRNKYSHTLEVNVEDSDVQKLKGILDSFKRSRNKQEMQAEESNYSVVGTIEAFTSLFCSYFAGVCTVLAKYDDMLKAKSHTGPDGKVTEPDYFDQITESGFKRHMTK